MANYSNLIEDIENGSGKFDLTKQYYVMNSSPEDIEVWWSKNEPEARGSGRYYIKSGDMGGPYPQFLAYHIVKNLVSREMDRDGKGNLKYSPTTRAAYEEKFLKEVEEGKEDPKTAQIREEERKKLMEEMKTEPISEGPLTSSETRRKAHGKKSHEFEGKQD